MAYKTAFSERHPENVKFETLFTYFERGNQIAIQMLEESSHEKSYCS